MTFRTLILRSLRFHARAHLGVVLGAAVGSAALIGALIVGDSVRGSLHDLALERLGGIHYAMAPSDRFFRAEPISVHFEPSFFGPPLAHRSGTNRNYAPIEVFPGLRLPATASARNGEARANQVQALAFSEGIAKLGGSSLLTNIAPDAVVLNESLAAQLKVQVGDTILLRVRKPSALSQDAIISSRSDASVALRLRVQAIVPGSGLGNFNLAASQVPPLNAFLRMDVMAKQAGVSGEANLLLSGPIWMGPKSVQFFHGGFQVEQTLRDRLASALASLSPRLGALVRRDSVPRLTEPASGAGFLDQEFASRLDFGDLELELRQLPKQRTFELRSSRIFLDPAVVQAAHSPPSPSLLGRNALQRRFKFDLSILTNHVDVLTYLVNQFQAGERTTPYSMVTATGAPVVPSDMQDDEILINQWLADDLQIGPGSDLALTYFLADSGARLIERTNHFRVRAVVPMTMPYADRSLMPEFPGIAKAERTEDWDAGFKLVHKIRDQDDKYWKEWRGTPKAFVTLSAGKKMWANRFGELTSIRFLVPDNMLQSELEEALPIKLLDSISPADLGLRFEPVRAQALAAANQAQDFGQLFIGFSFFLILAALILMALLFQFGLEHRTSEVGTLLSLGYTPKTVRWLLLLEGTALAMVGGVVGIAAGIGYARAMLVGLTTVWRGAVGTSALHFHLTGATLAIGLLASVAVSAVTIWLVLRKQAKRPARELLAEGQHAERDRSPVAPRPRRKDASENTEATSAIGAAAAGDRSRSGAVPGAAWVGGCAGLLALGLVGWALVKGEVSDAETFFSAGSLFLVAGLAFSAAFFALLNRSTAQRRLTVGSLGLRGCARRSKRSLATVGLLACGSFLVMAIGAFKLDANANAWKRSSGTGGFALLGRSTLPVVQDLNTEAGREFFGLNPKDLEGVEVVPLRVRDGDEASCLNLNRAQTPRLLGVNPQLLQNRGAFTFAKLAAEGATQHPWARLEEKLADGAVPAVGDLNSIVWAMGKKVGDTLSLTDEHGQPFKVRLVGGLANSILQGSLLISEAEFVKRFPSESGYRMFLIDAPSNRVAAVSATLTRALQDVGLELTPAAQRLAAFNAVQNTYLKTFQVLGGLGLLLGSAGLGVVVLRNVLERRGELALLRAVGFRRRTLQWLVLSEHAGLLWLGLGVGLVAALVAILPVLLAPGAEVQYLSLGVTLAAVFVSGLLWTWLATRLALRGELLKALRDE